MEALKQHWQVLDEKCAALSLRERGILLGTFLTLIAFVWLQFIMVPIQDQNKIHMQSLQQANDDLSRYAAQIQELTLKLGENPNDPLREEQKALQLRLNELAQEIESRLSNLVPPRKMATVMQAVLADYQGLKLRRARNLPVEPLKMQGTDKEVAADPQIEADSDSPEALSDDAVIFVHGFEMELEGEYFQTLRFLQRLETMEGFYWQAFDYVVDGYPKANITIQLNTLSLDEEWIGV
ncbi:MAG: hypothetical protein C9356_05125 [Oleiphilus sp.]|nr:MAG: hypothetical protein C9356_05125 [Oleiphilus sp.]